MIVIAFAACTFVKESGTKIQRDITKAYAATVFEIYFTGPDSVRVQEFVQLAAERLKGFIQVGQTPDTMMNDCFAIKRFSSISEEFQPPNRDVLSYSSVGLSEAEMSELANAGSGITIILLADQDSIVQKQRAITLLVGDLTRNHDVYIGDINTRRFYSPDSWSNSRISSFEGMNMLQEIVFHTYRDGEFCRLVSLGMDKFCLPDVSIRGIPCSDQESYGNLANAVVATWIEHSLIAEDSTFVVDLQRISDPGMKAGLTSDIKEGAEQRVELKLQSVSPEEGDNDNLQFGLVFKNPEYSNPQEEQNALLKSLFGVEDPLLRITHNDELLGASRRAKEKLPALRKLFNDGLGRGYSLLLKAPFETDSGGNEWMWVEVTRWNESIIEGILQNEPVEVSDLKSGARVTVNQEDIFDYILYKPDGTSEGNETGEIIDRMN